ncbi:uncharacterized protein LOC122274415 [Carya illinoinensis]|uniref:uncharacterized protein LOC122274415 n=1 Tax=Carya illinoinensis TaxID=32201 RepID=UPI001C728505|nr:uncharacterized protein LOC122274415 [Carya illinoinensis]
MSGAKVFPLRNLSIRGVFGKLGEPEKPEGGERDVGGSRRRYKKSKLKVRVGLPRKNPNVCKPAFSLPPKLRSLLPQDPNWDGKASVIQNYKSFGVVSNPNYLGVRSRTSHIIETESLQVPHPSLEPEAAPTDYDPIASDLKSALGKQRSDGKSAPPQPLTAMQRLHIGQLIEKYGDDYERMFMDTKLNSTQHSVASLEKLCKRYHMHKDRNPIMVSS